MTKHRIALLGAAMTALLCGGANAQDYRSYEGPAYYYDDRPALDDAVIVRPYYDRMQKRQLLGRIDGSINPVELSISRPVSFSDLNLSQDADYRELHARVLNTARDLCAELEARYPALRGDRSADRKCVRDATRNALRDVAYGAG